jgi:hypothetical protein
MHGGKGSCETVLILQNDLGNRLNEQCPPLYGGIMPSVTMKQARMMQAAAHNKEFAKKVGIPQSVAKDFNNADKKKTNWHSVFGKK